ncbi:MAG: hypothetical protein PHC61_04730, partial [Chitinivibrionales bacterium]|nr:hypothetical protein [Chitinivibrionales bacterium]
MICYVRTFYIIILIGLLRFAAGGACLNGTVSDSISKLLLQGVTVSLSGAAPIDTTDTLGRFTICGPATGVFRSAAAPLPYRPANCKGPASCIYDFAGKKTIV